VRSPRVLRREAHEGGVCARQKPLPSREERVLFAGRNALNDH
jgi:hypothetical protein